MIRLIWTLIGLPLLLSAQGNSVAKGIKWENGLNWEQLKTKAKAENKYIFLDCYATWCGPCKLMDKDVYSNDTVGEYLNKYFISVKVQFDSTGHDDKYVRQWRSDARRIQEKYQLQGFPSLLFFAPDGKLTYRVLGYAAIHDFIDAASLAMSPKSRDLYNHLEKYKQGVKDFSIMPDLVSAAVELLGDKALSETIAKDYKKNYLDKLTYDELCTRKNIGFIADNISLVENSNEKFFYLCYNQAAKVDSIVGRKGYSEGIVKWFITKEEIEDKLWNGKKPITENPDWSLLKSAITKKYNGSYADAIIRDAQLSFYKRINNWQEFARLFERKLSEFPPSANGKIYHPLFSDASGINFEAWDVFMRCNDTNVLKKAIAWADLSIELRRIEIKDSILLASTLCQVFDTKANLLYKLGWVREAITWEEKSLENAKIGTKNDQESFAVKLFISTLNKMKKGEPTYVEDGAIWNISLMPKKNNL
jgi:thioredoxin-related protein